MVLFGGRIYRTVPIPQHSKFQINTEYFCERVQFVNRCYELKIEFIAVEWLVKRFPNHHLH